MKKGKNNIKVEINNCAQCLSCMLICSFLKLKSFNPSESNILVKPSYFDNNEWVKTEIEFLEDCKSSCRACVNACFYGALKYIGGD